jgi:hypothetical protein
MKPEDKPKKMNTEGERVGVSQEFIQRVSAELQAIQRDRTEQR